MASTLQPDINITVLERDYPTALATDGQRWEDVHSTRKPAWTGRAIWTLLKGTTDRTMWRLKAFAGERVHVERERSDMATRVASLVTGCSFRSARHLEDVACERIVEQLGRALTRYEHARVIDASLELWEIANPTEILTALAGRAALKVGPCRDCGEDTPNAYLCDACKAGHVAPDRSNLRVAGAA